MLLKGVLGYAPSSKGVLRPAALQDELRETCAALGLPWLLFASSRSQLQCEPCSGALAAAFCGVRALPSP